MSTLPPVKGLLADSFFPTHLHYGLAGLLSLPQDADLLLSRISFRFHLSGSFLQAQTNFPSGTVQAISTIIPGHSLSAKDILAMAWEGAFVECF
jgi:hypothetical protein